MKFGRYDVAAFSSYFAYASCSVVFPIALVALAVDLGFDLEAGGMTAGGALPLASIVPMIVTMLLCGFLAARWGKRPTMGAAVALMGLGILLCAFAPVYGVLFLALMIAGTGQGVLEGLATPFVQALHPEEPGRYINFAHGFWSVGVLVSVLVTGGLISLGVPWRLLVAGTACLAFVAALLILLPAKGAAAYPEHQEPLPWQTVWSHAKQILTTPRFWLFYAAMFLAGGGEFSLTYWTASYVQLNLQAAAWAGGVATACFAGGMFIGRLGWGCLIRQHQLSRLILWSGLGGAAVTCLIPSLTDLWLLYVMLFVAGVATAPFWPSLQSYTADRMPETDSTMIFILLSCAGVPGCGVFAWLLGVLGDRGDLQNAFYLVPLCYLGIAGLITIDRLRPPRSVPLPGA